MTHTCETDRTRCQLFLTESIYRSEIWITSQNSQAIISHRNGFRPPARGALSLQTCRQVARTGTPSDYVLMTSHTCWVRASVRVSRYLAADETRPRRTPPTKQAKCPRRCRRQIPSLIMLMRSGFVVDIRQVLTIHRSSAGLGPWAKHLACGL